MAKTCKVCGANYRTSDTDGIECSEKEARAFQARLKQIGLTYMDLCLSCVQDGAAKFQPIEAVKETSRATEPARCYICGQLLKENERIQLEYVDYKKWWVYRHVRYGEFTGEFEKEYQGGIRPVSDICVQASYQIKLTRDGGIIPNPS